MGRNIYQSCMWQSPERVPTVSDGKIRGTMYTVLHMLQDATSRKYNNNNGNKMCAVPRVEHLLECMLLQLSASMKETEIRK